MTKGVQLWPGDSMRAFYRRHISHETALDAAATERLVDALTKATNRMLVWDMPQAPVAPAAPSKNIEKKPRENPKGSGTGKNTADAPVADAAAAESAFDPYAFSAMVVLAKQGKDALAKRLAEIKSVEHLTSLADAQHLGLDRSLTKIDDVRKAVLAAAEQRLADRRAAAS